MFVYQSPQHSATAAPPTDSELHKRGLGFGYIPPPAIVAAELNAQLDSIRTGLTPRRHNPRPPEEVRLAVALAKARNGGVSPNHFSPPPPLSSGPTSSNMLPGSLQGGSSGPGLSSSAPTIGSASKPEYYSMGKSVPAGVNWRYVDVLNNNQNDMKK